MPWPAFLNKPNLSPKDYEQQLYDLLINLDFKTEETSWIAPLKNFYNTVTKPYTAAITSSKNPSRLVDLSIEEDLKFFARYCYLKGGIYSDDGINTITQFVSIQLTKWQDEKVDNEKAPSQYTDIRNKIDIRIFFEMFHLFSSELLESFLTGGPFFDFTIPTGWLSRVQFTFFDFYIPFYDYLNPDNEDNIYAHKPQQIASKSHKTPSPKTMANITFLYYLRNASSKIEHLFSKINPRYDDGQLQFSLSLPKSCQHLRCYHKVISAGQFRFLLYVLQTLLYSNENPNFYSNLTYQYVIPSRKQMLHHLFNNKAFAELDDTVSLIELHDNLSKHFNSRGTGHSSPLHLNNHFRSYKNRPVSFLSTLLVHLMSPFYTHTLKQTNCNSQSLNQRISMKDELQLVYKAITEDRQTINELTDNIKQNLLGLLMFVSYSVDSMAYDELTLLLDIALLIDATFFETPRYRGFVKFLMKNGIDRLFFVAKKSGDFPDIIIDDDFYNKFGKRLLDYMLFEENRLIQFLFPKYNHIRPLIHQLLLTFAKGLPVNKQLKLLLRFYQDVPPLEDSDDTATVVGCNNTQATYELLRYFREKNASASQDQNPLLRDLRDLRDLLFLVVTTCPSIAVAHTDLALPNKINRNASATPVRGNLPQDLLTQKEHTTPQLTSDVTYVPQAPSAPEQQEGKAAEVDEKNNKQATCCVFCPDISTQLGLSPESIKLLLQTSATIRKQIAKCPNSGAHYGSYGIHNPWQTLSQATSLQALQQPLPPEHKLEALPLSTTQLDILSQTIIPLLHQQNQTLQSLLQQQAMESNNQIAQLSQDNANLKLQLYDLKKMIHLLHQDLQLKPTNLITHTTKPESSDITPGENPHLDIIFENEGATMDDEKSSSTPVANGTTVNFFRPSTSGVELPLVNPLEDDTLLQETESKEQPSSSSNLFSLNLL